jgi:hypothetical protein
VSQDATIIYQGLQEEKFRAERLEEQVNDLTELHQAETGNLKQALADAEEKLSYQSEERLRDLAEMLDACHAKVRQRWEIVDQRTSECKCAGLNALGTTIAYLAFYISINLT